MAKAEEMTDEVSPQGQAWVNYWGRSVPVEGIELTERTSAPEAALTAASAPALEGDGEENDARGQGPSPETSRGRKLKILALASLFLVAVGARARLAPESKSHNGKADREARAVTLEDCLAMEAEGYMDGDEPVRRDLRRGREARRPAEAPSRRRIMVCEELLATNGGGAGKYSKAGKSTKTAKSTKTYKSAKTTKSTKTKTSKTGKSSTSSDASRGYDDETSVSYGAPPASKPTTSDRPATYGPTSSTYAPTSYAPTDEPDPDAPCSGRGTLDPSGRQCTCNQGFFKTLVNGVPDCLKVVPVGLGCDGQDVPSCKEQKFSPEPKCCPRPPRGDLLLCIPTTGPNAGDCG